MLLVHLYGCLVASGKYRGKQHLRLNIGCGPNRKQGWVNLDMVSTAELRVDLRKRLPLDSSCCATVYSEHFFEHLEYPGEATLHVGECWRVLEQGGSLHIGVPNAGAALIGYADRHAKGELTRPFERHEAHPEWVVTRIDAINFMFRQNYLPWEHQHRWAYDFILLEKMLGECGFVNIRRRDFVPGLDSENRKNGTLYVVAEKPARGASAAA